MDSIIAEELLLSPDLEDRFLRALIEHPKLTTVVKDQVYVQYFSTRHKGIIFKAIISYYTTAESQITQDVLSVIFTEKYVTQSEILDNIIQQIFLIPCPDYKWILGQINLWIKKIRLHKTLYECAVNLKENKFSLAKEKLLKELRFNNIVSPTASNDLDLSKEDIFRIAFREQTLCANTGVHALDRILRGFYKKELFLILAPTNVGKSWAIIHFAVNVLFKGKYVLYFTLEMEKDVVLQRIIQRLVGGVVPYKEDEVKRMVKKWNSDFSDVVETEVDTILNTEKVNRVLDAFKKWKGMLKIIEYSSGDATINDILSNIHSFDVAFKKIPDIIFIDGLLDMKHSTKSDFRHSIGDTIKELRKIAVHFNIAVIVTHQGNRASLGAENVSLEHTGESLRIAQICDTAISLNQTKQEYKDKQLRINVMRSRNSQKWGEIKVYQDLATGQFCLHSERVE